MEAAYVYRVRSPAAPMQLQVSAGKQNSSNLDAHKRSAGLHRHMADNCIIW